MDRLSKRELLGLAATVAGLLLSVGVSGIGTVVFLDTSIPASVVSSGTVSAQVPSQVVYRDPSVQLPPMIAVLSPDTKVPERVKLGEGFFVHATFNIKEIRNSKGDSQAPPKDLSEIRRYLHRFLRISLSVADLSVEPQGPIPLSSSLSSLWSARANNPGTYTGVIKITFKHPDTSTQEITPKLEAESPDDLPITIRVPPEPPTISELIMGPAAVLGLLISLIGIITFVWSWRDRRKRIREEEAEKRRKEEEEKPKIYIGK